LAALAWIPSNGLCAAPENRIVLDLEPSPAHPRSSEGAFATLKSGRILFAYSQFYGGWHDNSASRIAAITSDDQGRTWTAPHVLFENGSNLNLMSVSFLRLASGKLAMTYLVKQTALECHPYFRTSSDEGATWSAALPMVDAPGYFVLNNDRIIQTRSGRLIAPVSYHFLGQKQKRMPSVVIWYFSDDEGATWNNSRTSWSMPVVSASGLQEPGAVELADGSLFSWARCDQGRQYGFRSRDDGLTWSPPEPTPLLSPTSPASIKRLPHSSTLLAFFNDHSGRFPLPALPDTRSPFVAALSPDGGETWPTRKVLENDPIGRYCYTAIEYAGDTLLLAYSAADAQAPHFGRLRLRRVALAWLTAP
jgi:sialidase-1